MPGIHVLIFDIAGRKTWRDGTQALPGSRRRASLSVRSARVVAAHHIRAARIAEDLDLRSGEPVPLLPRDDQLIQFLSYLSAPVAANFRLF